MRNKDDTSKASQCNHLSLIRASNWIKKKQQHRKGATIKEWILKKHAQWKPKQNKNRKKRRKKEIKNNKSDDGMGNILETQSKYKNVFHGRMRPDPCIAHHPAYATLFCYATEGCLENCGEPWSKEHLEVAIQRGPHILAKSLEVVACLRQAAFKKVEQGEAEIIRWDDIKDALHKNLKISPLAAVPHKSHQFQAILDLSFQLWLLGVKFPSINEAMLPLLDHKAMDQMGQVLRWLIHTVAQSNPAHGPVIFAKWNLKDGFWRLVVSEHDAWNFCYVLP